MPVELFSMEVRDVSGKLIYRQDKCSDAIDLTFLLPEHISFCKIIEWRFYAGQASSTER